LRAHRKLLARIKTIQRQREIGTQKTAEAAAQTAT